MYAAFFERSQFFRRFFVICQTKNLLTSDKFARQTGKSANISWKVKLQHTECASLISDDEKLLLKCFREWCSLMKSANMKCVVGENMQLSQPHMMTTSLIIVRELVELHEGNCVMATLEITIYLIHVN